MKRIVLIIALFTQLIAGPATSAGNSVSIPQTALEKIDASLLELEPLIQERIKRSGPNTPVPELDRVVRQIWERVAFDPAIQAKVKVDRALRAFFLQTITHLRHVSFDFEIEHPQYVHAKVLEGRFPAQPTLKAIADAKEFLQVANAPEQVVVKSAPAAPERELELLAAQKEFVKKAIDDSFNLYQELRARLAKGGGQASFPELAPVAEYLQLKILSSPAILEPCQANPHLAKYREIALAHLQETLTITENGSRAPYLKTVEAILRATEFLDVVQRAVDPSRSPKLYHSGRYEYYLHYLKGEIPNHIMMPTLVSLGATDILKSRGVPIGFWGINSEIQWVDGYHQTSYEFVIHDVNHTRRMYQFMKEEADRQGISVETLARKSDEFVKTKLVPLITIRKGDDETARNKKRLMKVLLFEILHEDALPATKEVIERAVLRPPNTITPFERIEGGQKVFYVMEPGATTLAYVFRKLAHDFYDMPGERIENIVSPEFRTRENIVEAAETLFKHLEIPIDRGLLESYAFTDAGFPRDFRETIVRDIAQRPSETVPLNEGSTLEPSGPRKSNSIIEPRLVPRLPVRSGK